MIALKKCANEGCNHMFPAYYFHDMCSEHATDDDKRKAKEKAFLIVGNHGQIGLFVNALSAFLPEDEGRVIREELLK